jgi:hypothetical protein
MMSWVQGIAAGDTHRATREKGSSLHCGLDAGRQRASIRASGVPECRRAQRAECANAKLSCPSRMGGSRDLGGGRGPRPCLASSGEMVSGVVAAATQRVGPEQCPHLAELGYRSRAGGRRRPHNSWKSRGGLWPRSASSRSVTTARRRVSHHFVSIPTMGNWRRYIERWRRGIPHRRVHDALGGIVQSELRQRTHPAARECELVAQVLVGTELAAGSQGRGRRLHEQRAHRSVQLQKAAIFVTFCPLSPSPWPSGDGGQCCHIQATWLHFPP